MHKQPFKKTVNADKLEELIEAAKHILWHWENGHICISAKALNCMIVLKEAIEAVEEGEQNA